MEAGPHIRPEDETQASQGTQAGWRLFRLVRRLEPRPNDFRSWLAANKVPDRKDPETLRIAAGVSCFETSEQARARAVRTGRVGPFVAEIFIPNDGCFIEVARTTESAGHYTVWASPMYLQSKVVSVKPA